MNKGTQKNNSMSDHFAKFRNQQTAKQYQKRFGAKTWCQDHGWLRTLSGILSYIFQLLFVFGATGGILLLFTDLGTAKKLVLPIGVLVLILMEAAQRISSDRFWDLWHSKKKFALLYFSISIGLFVGTTSIGMFGAYRGTHEVAAAPITITNDSLLTHLDGQKKEINTAITNLENTKWKGTIVADVRPTLVKQYAERTKIVEAINTRLAFIETNNHLAKAAQLSSTKMDAKIICFLFLVLAFLFECCMCFNSYYDFREHVENGGTAEVPTQSTQIIVPITTRRTNGTPVDPIDNTANTIIRGFANTPDTTTPTQTDTHSHTHTATQPQNVVPQQVIEKHTTSVIVNLGDLKRDARLHWERAHTSTSEKAKKRNLDKYKEEKATIEALKINVIEDGLRLKFK